jgi:hypothetical protein
MLNKMILLLGLSILTSRAESILPESIGNLAFMGIEYYEGKNPGYGVSFDYQDDKTTATLYVYDKSAVQQESSVAPELVSVQKVNVQKEIQKAVKMGAYKASTLLSTSDLQAQGFPWQMETFHITAADGRENFSIAAVSVKAGRFCKIRLTGPMRQKEATTTMLFACVKAFDAFGGKVDPKCDDPAWVLSMIDHFKRQANCSDDMTKDIVKTALQVAKSCGKATIPLTEQAVPWIKGMEGPKDATSTLLAAYVMGEIEAQLTKNKSLSGDALARATYPKVKAAYPGLKVAFFER